MRHVGATSFCAPIGHRQEHGDYRSWQPRPIVKPCSSTHSSKPPPLLKRSAGAACSASSSSSRATQWCSRKLVHVRTIPADGEQLNGKDSGECLNVLLEIARRRLLIGVADRALALLRQIGQLRGQRYEAQRPRVL